MSENTARGARLRGEAHAWARLTEADVREIRAAYRPFHRTLGMRGLARRYGVSLGAVQHAILGHTWAHVK